MGTFTGHAVPGTFFFCFGLWYVIQTYRRYYTCSHRRIPFTSTYTFQCDCLCGRLKDLPVEALFKVVVVVVGIVGETITGLGDNGPFSNNGQHITMFFFFGITGVIDVMIYYKVSLPADLDYVSSAVAFFIEWFLFKFHLHGRTELDIHVHTLLLYAIFLNGLAVLVEMKYRSSVLSPISRSFFCMLQGSWFWQVGFILYNPFPGTPWKPDDDGEMMVITMMFTWHFAANMILTLLIGLIIASIYRRKGLLVQDNSRDDIPMTSLLQHRSNGQTVVRLGSEDDDSDIEFQQPVSVR